jgi:hypothetical protein
LATNEKDYEGTILVCRGPQHRGQIWNWNAKRNKLLFIFTCSDQKAKHFKILASFIVLLKIIFLSFCVLFKILL